jgi:hypothetical protein
MKKVLNISLTTAVLLLLSTTISFAGATLAAVQLSGYPYVEDYNISNPGFIPESAYSIFSLPPLLGEARALDTGKLGAKIYTNGPSGGANAYIYDTYFISWPRLLPMGDLLALKVRLSGSIGITPDNVPPWTKEQYVYAQLWVGATTFPIGDPEYHRGVLNVSLSNPWVPTSGMLTAPTTDGVGDPIDNLFLDNRNKINFPINQPGNSFNLNGTFWIILKGMNPTWFSSGQVMQIELYTGVHSGTGFSNFYGTVELDPDNPISLYDSNTGSLRPLPVGTSYNSASALGIPMTPVVIPEPTATGNDKAIAIYVANDGDPTVSRANMDGTGGVDLGDLDGKLNGATYIALDVSAGKMYVTNWWNTSGVVRANLDGTGGEYLGDLNGTLNNSLGIALDVAAGKMYVVSYTNNTVSRANLDGTGGVSLGNLNGTLNNPVGIALDIAAGKMYVTNQGNNTVSRANLDGTGGISLGNLNGTLNNSAGIALDIAADKMYVPNHDNNTVSRANLDGTGGVSLGNLNGTLNGPAGIALDIASGKMYVTNNGNNTVSRANLDGTGGENLGDFNGNLDNPEGIALLFPVDIYVSSDALCNSHNPCSTNIQNGIAYASAPSIIKITQETYNENIILDFNRVTILQGGWDTNFTANSSSTTIEGSMTITHGTIIIENIILK